MPATAGRVRMPADNRMSVSDSLRTSEIWQKSVGYDPYAPDQQIDGNTRHNDIETKAKCLFALARLTGSSSSITPGACRKCGQVGHLSFQCRNLIALKPSISSCTHADSILRTEEFESNDSKRIKKAVRPPRERSRSPVRHEKRRHRMASTEEATKKNERDSSKHHHRRRRSRSYSIDRRKHRKARNAAP